MKITKIFLYGVFGAIAELSKIDCTTWNFYALLGCVVAIDILSAMIGWGKRK